MTAPKTHVKRDDIVIVCSGDDRGKTGKVLRVDAVRRIAVVEGVNFVKRHMRKTQDNPQGGIVEKEAPLALAKLRRYEEARDKKRAPAAKA
jgi:large subunit ribosomal protein L24